MSSSIRKPLDASVRIVLVDGKFDEPLAEAMFHESIEWEDFLQTLYNMTIPIMPAITRFVGQAPQGEGLSIDDGDWWYRIIDPITQSTNPTQIRRTNGEWRFLNCRIGFRHMMDQIYYGYGMSECHIEIQHQLQRETVALEQEIEDAAERDMLQNMEIQAQFEQQQEVDAYIRSGLREYYNQLVREPIINQNFAQHDQFQLRYNPVGSYQHQPTTKADLEADQAAAINAAARFSFARDVPSIPVPRPLPNGNGGPPADVQAKRRFLGGHAKSKRKQREAEEKAKEAETETEVEVEVEVKTRKAVRKKKTKEEDKGKKVAVKVEEVKDEEEIKEEIKEKQAASRAARAARRSGGF